MFISNSHAICKWHVSPHFVYSDFLIQPNNGWKFMLKVNKIQFSNFLAVAGVIEGTSQVIV